MSHTVKPKPTETSTPTPTPDAAATLVQNATREFKKDQIQPHPTMPGHFVIPQPGGYLSVGDDLTLYVHPDPLDKEAWVQPKAQPSGAFTVLLAARRDGVVRVHVWPV